MNDTTVYCNGCGSKIVGDDDYSTLTPGLCNHCDAADDPQDIEIANEFSRRLRGCLGAGEMETINQRNATDEYMMACATHDFCDANQSMIDTLDHFGLSMAHPVSVAWDIARGNKFQEVKP